MISKFLACQTSLTYKTIILDKCTAKQKRLVDKIISRARIGILIEGSIFILLYSITNNYIWIIIFFLFLGIYLIYMIRVDIKVHNYINYFILSRHYREFKFQRPNSGKKIRIANYRLIRKEIFRKECQSKDMTNKIFLYDLCSVVKPRIIELTTRNYHNTFILIAISLVISILFSLLFFLVQGNKDKMIITGISSFFFLYLGFMCDQISKNRLSKFSRKYKELLDTINDIIDE